VAAVVAREERVGHVDVRHPLLHGGIVVQARGRRDGRALQRRGEGVVEELVGWCDGDLIMLMRLAPRPVLLVVLEDGVGCDRAPT